VKLIVTMSQEKFDIEQCLLMAGKKINMETQVYLLRQDPDFKYGMKFSLKSRFQNRMSFDS